MLLTKPCLMAAIDRANGASKSLIAAQEVLRTAGGDVYE